MSDHPVPDSLARHLRDLEASLLQPDVRKSDTLVALLADDFVEFGTSGQVYDKQDLIALLKAETPSVQTTHNLKVQLLAPGVALLTYVIRHEASPPAYTLRSSLWTQRDARWQMVFHQGTRMTAEHGAA